MSERQRKLTITERLILTYIGYKTNRNFKFFMTNETLAKAICCKTSSTKVMVNKLVREGYLIKTYDDKGRRQLSLSGRHFCPLTGIEINHDNNDWLKQKLAQTEQDLNYYKSLYCLEKSKNERLSEELTNIKNQLISNKDAKIILFSLNDANC